MWSIVFFVNSCLLGVGLAMDAFSVSLANGLNEPRMGVRRMSLIAGVFAFFQFAMPMIGWICVHTIVTLFDNLTVFIPWIAFILLAFIGIKMIVDSHKEGEEEKGSSNLIVQAIATSIDALSVGFTIADYGFLRALIAGAIIAVVTFVICMLGGIIGKKLGQKFMKHAAHVGGVILIAIGLEILLSNLLA